MPPLDARDPDGIGAYVEEGVGPREAAICAGAGVEGRWLTGPDGSLSKRDDRGGASSISFAACRYPLVRWDSAVTDGSASEDDFGIGGWRNDDTKSLFHDCFRASTSKWA